MEIVVGSLVRSLAGRDKDRLFVAAAVDGCSVYIADGRKRKLDSPKRKNLRHISPVGKVIDTDGLTNKKLRRLIFEFSTQNL